MADGGTEKRSFQGAFIQSIKKIQQTHRNALQLSQDALQYLDKLLFQLLSSLLTPPQKTLQDVQEQFCRKIPEPLSTWVLEDSKYIREKGSKRKLLISEAKVKEIVKDLSPGVSDKQVYLFYAGVLEYMITDILKLTVSYIENFSVLSKELTEQDVKIAMFADKVLVNIFQSGEEDIPLLPVAKVDNADMSYSTLSRNLLAEEQRYLRDLQLIIKLIRKAFVERPHLFSENDINDIFGNIEDIAELSMKLIVMLEEAFEMVDDQNPTPLVGNSFEELAEECSFRVYTEYGYNLTRQETADRKSWRDQFHEILLKDQVDEALKSVCSGFRDVVWYVLPNLLLAPIYHCFYYFDQIKILEDHSTEPDDKECYSQVWSQITPIKLTLEGYASHLPKNRPRYC